MTPAGTVIVSIPMSVTLNIVVSDKLLLTVSPIFKCGGITNPVISSLTYDAHNMTFLKAFRGLSCGFTYDLLSNTKLIPLSSKTPFLY